MSMSGSIIKIPGVSLDIEANRFGGDASFLSAVKYVQSKGEIDLGRNMVQSDVDRFSLDQLEELSRKSNVFLV